MYEECHSSVSNRASVLHAWGVLLLRLSRLDSDSFLQDYDAAPPEKRSTGQIQKAK